MGSRLSSSVENTLPLSPGRLAARIAIVAAAFFLSGQLSFSLAVSHGIVTLVVFLAEGFALSAAILWGPRILPGVFLGQLLLALTNGLAWPLALGVSAINSIEALIGVLLFRRLKIHAAYDRLLDVALLLALIFFVLQPFSATLGTLLLWQGGVVPTDGMLNSWASWWFGNALGQALVTPLLLTLSTARFAADSFRRSLPNLVLPLLLAVMIAWLVLEGPQIVGANLGFGITAPLMVLLAAHYGMRITTLVTLIITVMMLYCTRLGMGPFAGVGGNLVELDLFLLRLALVGQFVGALFSERKVVEEELESQRHHLSEAQRIANLGNWILDFRNRHLVWSDEIYRILELDPKEVAPSEQAFLNRTHPEDRALIQQAFADALAHRVLYECTHRLVFPDGRIKHVRARGEIVRDETGRMLAYHGTLLDVTAMSQVEERLNLYAQIFRQSGEAIIVTDQNVNIIDANPAFTRLTGYALEEVRGQNPRLLASGKTPPETYKDMWQTLKERGAWSGELWDRTKAGDVYLKWMSVVALRDHYGKVTSYFASFVDITERKAAEERIHHIAHHDALTGLLNRFSLGHRLQQAVESSRREGQQLAVMFLDMNRFKPINDTYGHHVGDLLLIEVARRLVSCIRTSDFAARLGGDEFVVVLSGVASREAVESVAEKISDCLGQPYLLEDQSVESSASIGIGLFPEHGEHARELLHFADVAMYYAKKAGQGRHCFYRKEMEEQQG